MKKPTEDKVVLWNSRKWYINILGFWKEEGSRSAVLHHPSEMPRGLGKAWRLACREDV